MRTLLFLLASSAVFGAASDLNPPSWRGDAYTTTQQWDFQTNDTQPYADIWRNPFGQTQIRVLDGMYQENSYLTDGAWQWTNLRSPNKNLMQIDVQPNWPDSATNKQAWVQITWGVDFHGAAPPYNKGKMIYLSDVSYIDGVFPVPIIDTQNLGNDGTVEWYQTTFRVPFVDIIIHEEEDGYTWFEETDGPWSRLYVFPYHPFMTKPLTDTFDIYITGVVVDTICVPEPATLSLLAMGGLAILRQRSKR